MKGNLHNLGSLRKNKKSWLPKLKKEKKMENFLDTVLGFLPQRSVFWMALGTSLTILLFQYITQKLVKITELPYMQRKNQLTRKKLQSQLQKSQQTKS